MKTKLIAIIAFVLAALSACEQASTHVHKEKDIVQASSKYICPMHPDVISDSFGKCPVCGMDLVKASAATEDLMLTEAQLQLANVKVKTVDSHNVGESLILNGTLTTDESRRTSVSSTVGGRIEKLFVKETGVPVANGQPLYELYSESLLTLQQEYLMAKEQYEKLHNGEGRYKSLLEATRRKLLLYGLTEGQIQNLNKRSVKPRITFFSPASGTVTAIKWQEGQYINEGTAIFELEDLTSLWVEAEVYPGEARTMKRGDQISIRIAGAPIERAEISFLSSQLENGSQIFLLRARLDNSDGRFKPGQHAQVSYSDASRKVLAIPADAVIRNEQGEHIYVQTARNTFRPQTVRTGVESDGYTEILEGVHEGDTVVVSGAYLLYSEMVLRLGREPLSAHHEMVNSKHAHEQEK